LGTRLGTTEPLFIGNFLGKELGKKKMRRRLIVGQGDSRSNSLLLKIVSLVAMMLHCIRKTPGQRRILPNFDTNLACRCRYHATSTGQFYKRN
jgi:hypothetical protein